jgi:pyruvate/oxaloacetate carboxyltransferase
LVKAAEIPGGMYTNMVAQLKQLHNEDILPRAMELIPPVRLAAGLPPLVTPTSQIVGVQAVNCAMDEKNGKPLYTTKSVQFVNLVKGEYGRTPVPVDPAFREKITGSPVETNYDTSKHKMQPNPALEQCGGVPLAADEKEVLLLELFPMVARDFLTRTKCARHEAEVSRAAAEEAARAAAAEASRRAAEPVIEGPVIVAPLPGRVLLFMVKQGDTVSDKTDTFVLEAMKMENNIAAETTGRVKRLLVPEGANVAAGQPVVELE